MGLAGSSPLTAFLRFIHSTVTPLSCKRHDVVAAAERANARRAAARRLSAYTPLDLRPSFARMAALRYYRGLPAWTRTLLRQTHTLETDSAAAGLMYFYIKHRVDKIDLLVFCPVEVKSFPVCSQRIPRWRKQSHARRHGHDVPCRHAHAVMCRFGTMPFLLRLISWWAHRCRLARPAWPVKHARENAYRHCGLHAVVRALDALKH